MANMTDWDDDISSEDEIDGNIIELTDIVDEGLEDDTDEDIIELTDIVEQGNIELDLDIVNQDEPEVEEDLELEDETFFNEELELETTDPMEDGSVEYDQETVLSKDLGLSPELLEAALERVIEKKFANKIETLLFEVMEKVIKKEIVAIKESLQKDLDQIGNV